jgi:uncharacterized protein (DUF2141 family)
MALGVGLAAQTRAVTGTGRIDGRVVVNDDGGAVRRAIVTISGGGLSHGRSVISDDNGAFVFTDLPAGRFTLTASRSAFIPSSYGARTPGQPGTRLSLAYGQHVTDVLIRVARGAVLSGTVRNEIGEPLPNVIVAFSGTQTLDPRSGVSDRDADDCNRLCGSVITDDRGIYRVFGLPAGSYIVAAFYDVSARVEMVTTAEVDAAFAEAQRRFSRAGAAVGSLMSSGPPARTQSPAPPTSEYSYAAVFYPGTADATAAQRIAVASGEERTGLDIVLAPTPTVRVEGTVVSSAGALPRLAMDMTPHNTVPIPDDMQPEPGTARSPYTHPVPSGDFQFARVTPGRYTITARGVAGQAVADADGRIMRITSDGPAPAPLWAAADVMVTGSDLSGVQLTLRPAFRVMGRIQLSGDSPRPQSLEHVPVALVRAPADPAAASGTNLAAFRGLPVPKSAAEADGGFELTPVYPGIYGITASVPGSIWRLQSAAVAGHDLLDDPLAIAPDSGADVTGVVLTFTDRHTEITGTLQTPAGAPATEYFIVVFTTERRWWRPDGRRLAFARPATDGQFVIRDLPPGEYYLAALTDLETSGWRTPEFLDQVVPGALKLIVADDAVTTQDVRIAY